MSKYTTELRHICDEFSRETVESWFKDYDLSDYLTTEQIETISIAGIWNKDKLASLIVDHYYMREIGLETPALFRHYVKFTMKEIMESKLPLIYTISINYNPLINVDFTETYNRSINTQGRVDDKNLSVYSDTPQGQISLNNILEGTYASNTEGNTGENTSSSSTGETYTKHVTGNSGVSATNQKMILQYRENILSINKDIINELNKLFMGIY